jgi:hypothetical protein
MISTLIRMLEKWSVYCEWLKQEIRAIFFNRLNQRDSFVYRDVLDESVGVLF